MGGIDSSFRLEKQAVVVHSGGMDSSICLAMAVRQFGAAEVLSLSFSYGQRHSVEVDRAAKISRDWGVDHLILEIPFMQQITVNSLTDHSMKIELSPDGKANSLVVGRNGLMGRIAAIHAHSLGAHYVYMGLIEVDGRINGYRDCSRSYVAKLQEMLRMDLDDSSFEIRTPLIAMTKLQAFEVAHELRVLAYLLENTVSCYHGIDSLGCQVCPSCLLRNEALRDFRSAHPQFLSPGT